MQIDRKNYVEHIYDYTPERYSCYEPYCHMVSDSNPLTEIESIRNSNNISISGFRFFDRIEITNYQEQKTYGKPHNFSNVFYFGKRLNKEMIIELSKTNIKLLMYATDKDCQSIILCDNGRVIVNPGHYCMTVEELEIELNKDENEASKQYVKRQYL